MDHKKLKRLKYLIYCMYNIYNIGNGIKETAIRDLWAPAIFLNF